MKGPPEHALNIFDPAVKANPYPYYAQMRELGPVTANPMLLGQFMVTGYDEVANVLGDSEHFSMGSLRGLGAADSILARTPTMLTSDPPEHTRLREPVSRALSPRLIQEQASWIYQAAREMLTPLRDGETIDTVSCFAERLPALVIAQMLGVATTDLDDFITWSNDLLAGALDLFADGEKLRRSAECTQNLCDYFAAEVKSRRDAPERDDLVGRLLAANCDSRLSDDEMYAACILLLLGGNETTTKLITNSVLSLARHPDERARLVVDQELLTPAVEELLRYDTPVQGDVRIARTDVGLGGAFIPAGSLVIALLGAANHDPSRFEDPERLDLRRNPNPLLSFGRGVHFCLGANLARLEARMALKALIEVAPSYGLVEPEAELVYDGPTFFFHAPSRLAIRRD
jgi:pimeloyl-[acyl-carrier protein] synthase